MTRKLLVTLALLSVTAMSLSACGDDDNDNDASSGGGGTSAECSGDAIPEADVKLPADFPQPGELTITESTKAGPSQVLDGYWDSGVEEAYEEWHREFETAGYTILFDELEEDDAEISYKSADGSSTGQIAFRVECGTEDKIKIHITNRPA